MLPCVVVWGVRPVGFGGVAANVPPGIDDQPHTYMVRDRLKFPCKVIVVQQLTASINTVGANVCTLAASVLAAPLLTRPIH